MSDDALARSMALFDLRPPKLLTKVNRKKTPVAFAVGPDRKPFPVSFLSDHVWHFEAYITADNLTESDRMIDWRIKLPDGYLTDPKYASLLEASQDFIWSLFADPIEGLTRPSHMTLRTKVICLIPLLRWMVKQGLTRFADLAGHTMNYLPASRKKERGSGEVRAEVTKNRLFILEHLYDQRNKLRDALPSHPWRDETATSLAGVKRGWLFPRNKTEALPDAVVDELGRKALDYLQHAEPVLAAFEKMVAAGEETLRMVAERDWQDVSKRVAKSESRTAVARAAGYRGVDALEAEIIRLRTACYIVIGLFSGVRDSELLGIGKDCIAHRRSKDDTVNTIWLHGEIIKGGEKPKAWQVSESVELAVNILTRLTALLRDQLKVELDELERQIPLSIATRKAKLVARYSKVKRQQDKLFLVAVSLRHNEVGVLSGLAMSRNLKSFCSDLGICGEDGEPLSLKSSDFRPTYARLMARSEMGDLLTLRDHLGHRSLRTTIGYCGDAPDNYDVDTELMQMIEIAKQGRQEEIMGDILTTDKPLANGGHFLNAWRASVRTAKNKEELITQFSGTLTLNGTGHSWCVGAIDGKSCGGFCILEAKMCPDCNYGIISEEHRPVWEGIKEQQEEALALGDLGKPGIARAKEIVAVAIKVLDRLDRKSDPAPIRFAHYGEIGRPKIVTQLTVVADAPAKGGLAHE